MPQSLRSILGNSNRIRKPSRPAPSRSTASSPSSSPSKKPPPPPPSSSSSSSSSARKSRKDRNNANHGESEADLFEDKLDDEGTARLLAEELTLRDVIQSMRYIRAHMFTPVPERGIHSARTTELLRYRAATPPIVTVGHLTAVLGVPPTRAEREAADLMRRGVIRKVRLDRRGWQGEAFIETSDLEDMVRDEPTGLPDETREGFIRFLRENPTIQTIHVPGSSGLSDSQADDLVRAGFLTSSIHAGGSSTLHVRPAERTTLTSIQRVSRHASGSLFAVGGPNALHLSGGGGGGASSPNLAHHTSYSSPSSSSPSSSAELRISVPGHGRYLKLAAATVDWVREALGKTKWGEGPESWLKERFEGGGLYGPRWKEYWGVEWEWVLGEAIGLGSVEIFETKSVGRGVRALGG
ncbi:hypothetical protein ACRE_041850 [Hapsidospora chrysogenum ATCC 11550]|uniref:Uncharacterized protein n=1 Tax=Hapsidospora chrysogenum (strain ATCC 11550 / CBS 779.69 / DSM 880 / IAM 14645 / JCM 23072 / IMI 49137) TaxID=857340 RepID=A0A086T6J0_HAPC1|nr:hypothetical protein ACRE_041850 [Hapsidospora chrysogenum ATCC 11550]